MKLYGGILFFFFYKRTSINISLVTVMWSNVDLFFYVPENQIKFKVSSRINAIVHDVVTSPRISLNPMDQPKPKSTILLLYQSFYTDLCKIYVHSFLPWAVLDAHTHYIFIQLRTS